MLELEYSRQRQGRLVEILAERKLDAAVFGSRHHVYYFTGFLTNWLHHSATIVFEDGATWLIRSNRETSAAAADEVVDFEADWMATLRQEQPDAVAGLVAAALGDRNARRIGIDDSAVSTQLGLQFESRRESLEPELWQLRRRKDGDELALMKRAIACTEAMYARAREIIAPGVQELSVYAELYRAAVESAGEPLTALLGNDFACGVPGGPARHERHARNGELYILDLGPAYRGYFADNCRTIAVNRNPTDLQWQAWETQRGALGIVERMAKPGARCVEIYDAVDLHLRSARGTGHVHHLGHGVGLQPHEFPHLNPHWDDVLMEGEIFTAEPGIYSPELAGGIRIENQYLVTATGVENLTRFPMEL